MSVALRSKHGCWTCKLRRKKCDETRPHCSTCESLFITCYGFGPRPEWMDNGDKEKAVRHSLKETVKSTSRRKDPLQLPKQGGSVVKIAPKPSNDSLEPFSWPDSKTPNARLLIPLDHLPSKQRAGYKVLQDGSAVSITVIYRS
jgi:hypothetical protein